MTSSQRATNPAVHLHHSANELFTAACARVLDTGRIAAPRGLPTKEVLGSSLRLADPRSRFVDLPPYRVISPAFAVAEALWIPSGSGGAWIHDFNLSLAAYVGDGAPHGAYGPRLRAWAGIDQFDRVRRLLLNDPDTRRAVLTIFDPAKDLTDERDIPCTLSHRFYLRDGVLHMVTTMRSQDVWRGLPYDLFTATLLLELMAGWIGAQVGCWHHEVDSLHLYEAEWLPSEEMISAAADTTTTAMKALTVGWKEFDPLLDQVIAGERVGHAGWDDLADVMAAFRSWRSGAQDAARHRASGGGLMSAALIRWFARTAARATAGAAS